MRTLEPIQIVKALVFGVSLMPFLLLLVRLFTDELGVNPVETVTHQTGLWSLRFLLLTLAITPLRRLTGWNALIRLCRMLGLYAFFYVCLHMLTWLVLDHFFDWVEIAKDIGKRSYITAGFAAFVLLVPLAATSTNRMIKRLGGSRWKRLHSIVYLIGTLAVLHFLWLVKADIREPLVYGIALTVLLAFRIPAPARLMPAKDGPTQAELTPAKFLYTNRTMRLHATMSKFVLIALVITWSPGFGGVMYQACEADCCAPAADDAGCSKATGEQANEMSAKSKAEDCRCNDTCDSMCSECIYFYVGAIEALKRLTPTASSFSSSR
ncbi:MAG: sulfite oxidase heme-binding subunit YedZ, partial [Gammaproteobacteria bacterium]